MILIVTQCFPPDRGGIENVMGGLADGLSAAGEEVAVLADLIRGGEAERAWEYPVARFTGPKPWRRWKKMRAAKQLSHNMRLKAVIADSWKSIERIADPRAPLLVLAHGMEYPHHASEEKRARIRSSLAKADVVIANSAYTAGLVEPYITGETKLTVIHPPILPQPEPSAAAVTALAQRVGAGPMILTLCRLEPRKGIDQVIHAMPVLLQHCPALRYVVAGSGEDLSRLQALAQECGVAPSVQFVGAVDGDSKAALYARADLFAMPVRREGNSVEGFGLTYIEAGWYGCPSLGGRSGGAVDAVTDGVTGLTCDGENAAEVEACLLQLLGDDSLRQRLGTAAQKRAHTEMQWPQAIAKYQALIGAVEAVDEDA